MSKKCSKCDKTVYPLEEVKCLEKIWHKSCFKCQECGMTLSMRNYKGFNRLPYCTAHCPQAKHTTVADTPEIRRIQENTKIQSSVKYHEEFEKQKGKVTQIADDPETLRIRQNTRIISNVAYHGDLERKAAMEQKRPAADGSGEDGGDGFSNDDDARSISPANSLGNRQPEMAANQVQSAPGLSRNAVANVIAAELESPPHAKDSPYSSRQASTVIYTSEFGPEAQNIYWGHGSTVIYCSDTGPVSSPPQRRIGSIANYDPINDNYGSIAGAQHHQQQQQQQHHQPQPQQQQQQQHSDPYRTAGGDHGMPQIQKAMGHKYRAMYDYRAMDSDEVSFLDGDIIVNCTPVDEGWMTGVVERTGDRGMLPANYVEMVN